MKKILIAETIDWNSSVQIGSHHYARHFLEHGDEVLWVSQYIHPLSFLTGCRERTKYAFSLSRGARSSEHERLSLYVPFTILPCRRHWLFDSKVVGKLSLYCTFPSVKSVLTRLGFDKVDVVWISNPLFAEIANIVKHDVLVFRVNDLYAGFRGMPSCIEEFEKALIKSADLVFVTSKVLAKHVENLGGKGIYLPNGAEVEHFLSPMPLPADYLGIPPPRAVYAGAIERWFDTDLVASIARDLPDMSFVLIGRCEGVENSVFSSMPNVYLLGPKPYKELPGYYQHADVGIIPFKVNEFTAAINPNKLYEYFSAGLPVVSTYLPEVEPLKPLVKIAQDSKEFAAFLREALEEEKNSLREERIQCAKSNSWKARFDEAMAYISDLLSSRNTGAA
ncbi:MAG: glycosyltransferase [Armatimonadota bacterium]|nr:glycosyltransferase [Armatimonadota bacterium]